MPLPQWQERIGRPTQRIGDVGRSELAESCRELTSRSRVIDDQSEELFWSGLIDAEHGLHELTTAERRCEVDRLHARPCLRGNERLTGDKDLRLGAKEAAALGG